MPKYAEVIFETGSKSLLSYENEDDVKKFVAEHHRRAVEGEPGAPQEQYGRNDLDASDFAVMPTIDRMKERPAERITKVYLFNGDPTAAYESRVSAKVVNNLVDGMANDDGTIDHEQLYRALRDEASPVHTLDQGRHASNFKVQPDGELDLSFLGGAA